MSEEYANLQDINYRDQTEILRKSFSEEEIGRIIIHALQKERAMSTGDNLTNFRTAMAKNLKAKLNEAITSTKANNFDKDKYIQIVLNGLDRYEYRQPRDIDKMRNERLHTCFYRLGLRMGFSGNFYSTVFKIIKEAQPNIGDKNIKRHYDNAIDDVVRNYLSSKEDNEAAA